MLQFKIRTRKANEPVGVVWSTSNDSDRLFECQTSLATLHKQQQCLNQTDSECSFTL